MAKTVLKDVATKINSVDLSNFVQKIEVDLKADDVDVTGFGSVAHEHARGLSDDQITATFFQSFEAAQVDATLAPLYFSGSAFPIVVTPTSGTVSATNPSYSGTFTMLEYTPISGSPGDASTMDITFVNSSQAGITRGTVAS